jgi:hypothetical protein
MYSGCGRTNVEKTSKTFALNIFKRGVVSYTSYFQSFLNCSLFIVKRRYYAVLEINLCSQHFVSRWHIIFIIMPAVYRLMLRNLYVSLESNANILFDLLFL